MFYKRKSKYLQTLYDIDSQAFHKLTWTILSESVLAITLFLSRRKI